MARSLFPHGLALSSLIGGIDASCAQLLARLLSAKTSFKQESYARKCAHGGTLINQNPPSLNPATSNKPPPPA
ncbi:hypothetical protein PR001_g5786 [Phytophthora rubi]|uniref:Uncharacterized protein n=1 Tax=Phytophthora rubi TaxID=129364 RepID=A0A6A3NGE5_9STRA|nr:hypothetical protein PR001_g5786 [Phytophthora rubi]